jgi:plastocyanin
MSRGLFTAIACTALAALAGCGSSSGSSSSSSASTTSSASTANTIGAGKPGSGLKPSTTPKFASPPASAPVRSGTVQIAYRNIAIAPDTLKVRVGSTIRWTNFDAIEHNVTSEGDRSKIGQQKFASKNFGEGGTFEIKALKPGAINYECTIHPTSMNGTIVVVQ